MSKLIKLTTVPIIIILFIISVYGGVEKDGEYVRFYTTKNASSVFLAGEFNQWSKDATPMKKKGNQFFVKLKLAPGYYQYKFVIDGNWMQDPDNPVGVDDNYGGLNSVIHVKKNGKIVMETYADKPPEIDDDYSVSGGTLFLNIIWHQHQPLYLNPETGVLTGPWVRVHGTKDYYDMAAILEKYPDIHLTINLTSVLLFQLLQYVNNLKPFVDLKNNTVDAKAYFKSGKRTDYQLELLLKDTSKFNQKDIEHLIGGYWNAFGISDVMINRFPEYKKLKYDTPKPYTLEQMRRIKFFHALAWFDPDFLRGPVKTPMGIVDLSNIVKEEKGKFYLKVKITENLCNHLVAETYKVLASIIPEHKKLQYNAKAHSGQIEVITTPFYHPILPLIYNTDTAKVCQPYDQMPLRFSYPEDAFYQVKKATLFYTKNFGIRPNGMWPGEGAVSEDIVPLLADNNIIWTATADSVLKKSSPSNLPITSPYRVEKKGKNVVFVFRNTELSDKIGFRYQKLYGEAAADDFIRSILKYMPPKGKEAMLTVILDGENAWEWFTKDNDAKDFLNAMYRKLSKLESQNIITVTPSEYIFGDSKRGIKPHPVKTIPKINKLWPGSWINADYSTWIGEPEENSAWDYLLKVRKFLTRTGIPRPKDNKIPQKGTRAYYGFMAWEEMYAAEGSDWFWWYGKDQTAPGGDKPFDIAYISHLNNIGSYAKKWGFKGKIPVFQGLIRGDQQKEHGQGAMAMSKNEKKVNVLFQCNAKKVKVKDAVFIVGSKKVLGNWMPNLIKMYDNGTHGDKKAHDGIWSIKFDFNVGEKVQYKYTNSGKKGIWTGSEEFPVANRTIVVDNKDMELMDMFGVK